MTVEDQIRQKLEQAFAPDNLQIFNDSHMHHGHAGSPGTGESHFRIVVISESFRGKSRIECHRMVNDILADELAGPVHALAIEASAPAG